MAEVRVQSEGSLRAVQASGSGRSWATASAPVSGFVGYVRSFTFTSARTLATIMERGNPDHHKEAARTPIDLTVNFAWTGSHRTPASGSGASVPMDHLEFRASEPENGGSGRYYQFYGAAQQSIQFTEGESEDTVQIQYRCLGMSGANPSGYLS